MDILLGLIPLAIVAGLWFALRRSWWFYPAAFALGVLYTVLTNDLSREPDAAHAIAYCLGGGMVVPIIVGGCQLLGFAWRRAVR